jgi:hypothetical protein
MDKFGGIDLHSNNSVVVVSDDLLERRPGRLYDYQSQQCSGEYQRPPVKVVVNNVSVSGAGVSATDDFLVVGHEPRRGRLHASGYSVCPSEKPARRGWAGRLRVREMGELHLVCGFRKFVFPIATSPMRCKGS